MLSCEYCKISKNSFFYRTPLTAASELKSHISDIYLNKSKEKLFLCFDNSHGNQTNTTKKIWFFLYIVNINENLKKIDEKKRLSIYNRATILIKHRQLRIKTFSQVLFARAICHTSKHFCTCVGVCSCDRTPLVKRPAITCRFSKYFQILHIFAQIFKYFALFCLFLTFFCPFSEKLHACPYFVE